MLDSLVGAASNMHLLSEETLRNNTLAVAKAAAEGAEVAASQTGIPRERKNTSLIVAPARKPSLRRGSGSLPDPGAHVVGIWMRALYEGFKAKYPE